MSQIEKTTELRLVPQHLVDAWADACRAVEAAKDAKTFGSMSDDFFYTNGGHARAMQAIHRAEDVRDAAWAAIEAWSEHAMETAHEVSTEMAADRDRD